MNLIYIKLISNKKKKKNEIERKSMSTFNLLIFDFTMQRMLHEHSTRENTERAKEKKKKEDILTRDCLCSHART